VKLPTRFAATSSVLGTLVVRVPVDAIWPEPEAATVAFSGLVRSRPLYSKIRISGKIAATEKRAVTTLPAALRMFLA
jgi:hypothetical protein